MRILLPGVLAMTAIVVASNILVQYPLGAFLTWGALTYPFAFLVTDLTNRLQGPAAARRVVLAGFAVGILCSFIGTRIVGEFGPLVTFRIALGSGLAFLCAQLLDIAVFNRLRQGSWWRAPLVSTLVSSTLDTAIFFTVAFSAALSAIEPGNDVSWATAAAPLLGIGPEAPFWVSLAIGDWLVKLLLAVVALLPFRLAVAKRGAKVA
ncbi:queuosine precursor transporter [Rhodobacter calidifons]|uniref:Probable queuosine precursor transporter n=1 Tax=Rhodobacter calidifons TaxID=2715277 RepID=A0ABX0G9G9_9RHOB|nr:queuosine precursor transporter [Rhodobacter calidifons]NHB77891.1 queuosine precursor transporter [Rhodobacter calidifons]